MIPQFFGGYTRMPNSLLDDKLADLTGNAAKVLLYIWRRSVGFNRLSAEISLNQFQKGTTGLDGKQLDKGVGIGGKSNLIRAIRELEEAGLIECERSERHITNYSIAGVKMVYETTAPSPETGLPPSPETGLHVVPKQDYQQPQNSPHRNKEKKRENSASISASGIDFSKFEPGGKYHKLVSDQDQDETGLDAAKCESCGKPMLAGAGAGEVCLNCSLSAASFVTQKAPDHSEFKRKAKRR